MQTFVSNLTATMLLVHALVGCCRHLDHQCRTCERTEVSNSLACGCCHHEHAPPAERPAAPCDCRIECRTLCISLPPEKTLLNVGQSRLCIDAVTVTSTVATFYASATHIDCSARRRFRASEPPLRLHLLHQVILV
jgi:hypothetical protein